MRLLGDMPRLARAFVLSTGMAFVPFMAFSQEQENLAPEPLDTITQTAADDYPDVEALLRSAGIPEEEVSGAMEIMYQNLFRVSRQYIRPVEMETLERSIYEGVGKRLDGRAERLEKANAGVQEVTTELEALRAERTALQDAGSDIPAELGDKIIEADLKLRTARLELKRAELYQQINGEALINAGLNYALKGLDPHSTFHMGQDPLASVRLDDTPAGGAGIGVMIEADGESDYVLEQGVLIKSVLDPADNTPAYKAGLKAGELITHIDDEPLSGLLMKDAQSIIGGTPGSRIKLTVLNPAGEQRNVTLNRAVVQLKNVTHRIVDGNIGYMHINAFMDDQVAEDITKAIKDIQDRLGGADNVAGYIISVRDNGGGLLTEVIELSNLFINGEDFDHGYGADVPEDVKRRNSVVTTRNREGMDERFLTTPGDIIEGKPLVVLINGGSASASEIFAGTIQQYRGKIVGITTFGKGTVQAISAGPGNIGELKQTISEYTYGPGNADTSMGFSPQWEGVKPNVYTPFEPQAGMSEAVLKNSIRSDGRRSAYSEPEMTCDKVEDWPLLQPGDLDDSFIDPRSNEYDYLAECGSMVIKGHIQTAPKKYLEIRPYSAADVPEPIHELTPE